MPVEAAEGFSCALELFFLVREDGKVCIPHLVHIFEDAGVFLDRGIDPGPPVIAWTGWRCDISLG